MRLAFMGTPAFAAPVLGELIAAGHEIAAVYTRAPQPSGRGKRLTPSPVQQLAESHGLPVFAPKSLKKTAEQEAFRDLDLDVAVVVAYGLILPQAVLDAPKHGCLNLHASLLPRWRGAAPIQRAIMAGDKKTGVQVMQMEAGLDTGPILLSETTPITPDDTFQSLHDRLSEIAAQLAPRALAALGRGSLTSEPQATEGVEYAEKISPADAKIDWTRSAAEIDYHIRGLSPFPGARFEIDGVQIKALFSALADGAGAPGEILRSNDRLVVACGDGAIDLMRLQRAGKKPQDAEAFLRGFPIETGKTCS